MSVELSYSNQAGRKYLPLKKIMNAVSTAVNDVLGDVEGSISVVICDDNFIHELNRTYLKHDYPTDVITFVLDEVPLEAEIYISSDTAAVQAAEYKVSLTQELARLAIHGVLHTAGYDDSTKQSRQKMHELENKYLKLAGIVNV